MVDATFFGIVTSIFLVAGASFLAEEGSFLPNTVSFFPIDLPFSTNSGCFFIGFCRAGTVVLGLVVVTFFTRGCFDALGPVGYNVVVAVFLSMCFSY